MFKLQDPPSIVDQVTVTPLHGDAFELGVTWRQFGKHERFALLREQQTDARLLVQAMADWSGVCDNAGAPLPLNERTLAALLDHLEPSTPVTLIQRWVEKQVEAASGN